MGGYQDSESKAITCPQRVLLQLHLEHGRALFNIGIGANERVCPIAWDSFWNGVALCLPAEVVACCASAEADPGPKQLVRAPWCVLAKVTLIALGTCGLWATLALRRQAGPQRATPAYEIDRVLTFGLWR